MQIKNNHGKGNSKKAQMEEEENYLVTVVGAIARTEPEIQFQDSW